MIISGEFSNRNEIFDNLRRDKNVVEMEGARRDKKRGMTDCNDWHEGVVTDNDVFGVKGRKTGGKRDNVEAGFEIRRSPGVHEPVGCRWLLKHHCIHGMDKGALVPRWRR